ncbi:hypothetical protein [Enterobacter roggenkampii]|uniref:hypothetical protein n=1 Tax=Enterobacter roggenkampii TaxID=1812935 RepID=UPI0032AFA92D
MRALQVYMVDMIATEYEAKCSALNVVVFLMLVGSVAADTKATKEMLTHSTTATQQQKPLIGYEDSRLTGRNLRHQAHNR